MDFFSLYIIIPCFVGIFMQLLYISRLVVQNRLVKAKDKLLLNVFISSMLTNVGLILMSLTSTDCYVSQALITYGFNSSTAFSVYYLYYEYLYIKYCNQTLVKRKHLSMYVSLIIHILSFGLALAQIINQNYFMNQFFLSTTCNVFAFQYFILTLLIYKTYIGQKQSLTSFVIQSFISHFNKKNLEIQNYKMDFIHSQINYFYYILNFIEQILIKFCQINSSVFQIGGVNADQQGTCYELVNSQFLNKQYVFVVCHLVPILIGIILMTMQLYNIAIRLPKKYFIQVSIRKIFLPIFCLIFYFGIGIQVTLQLCYSLDARDLLNRDNPSFYKAEMWRLVGLYSLSSFGILYCIFQIIFNRKKTLQNKRFLSNSSTDDMNQQDSLEKNALYKHFLSDDETLPGVQIKLNSKNKNKKTIN